MKLKRIAIILGALAAIAICVGVFMKFKRKSAAKVHPAAATAPAQPATAGASEDITPEPSADTKPKRSSYNSPEVGSPMGGTGRYATSSGSQVVNDGIAKAQPSQTQPQGDEGATTDTKGGRQRKFGNIVTGESHEGGLPRFALSHLHSRADDRSFASKTPAGEAIEALNDVSPELADALKKRMAGGNTNPATLITDFAKKLKADAGNVPAGVEGEPSIGGQRRRAAAQQAPSPYYLHHGTLVEVQLVNTLESFSPGPILGTVVHDVRSLDGELVIPAGTRAVGMMSGSNKDRILAQADWKMILTGGDFAGRCLPLTGSIMTAQNGFILDKDKTRPEFVVFGPDDMKVGMVGYLIQPKGWNDLKLFAAEFINKMGSTQMSTNTGSLTGQQTPDNSVKNAFIGGGQGVMNRYADGILKEVEANSPFVLVPGGRSFYIFLTAPADMQISSVPLAEDAEATARAEDAENKEILRSKRLAGTQANLQSLLTNNKPVSGNK